MMVGSCAEASRAYHTHVKLWALLLAVFVGIRETSALANRPAHRDLPEARSIRRSAISSEAVGFMVASIGGGLTGTPTVVKETKGWYKNIAKPTWCPSNGAFAPVWTCLYATMGYSAFMVKARTGLSVPLKLFLVHYLLNLTWVPVFFGYHKIVAASYINVALVVTLGGVIAMFSRISPLAAALLVPYLLWVLLASALNFEICRLNPEKAA